MRRSSAFVWNMIGSICYSFSSILHLLVVTRVCGAKEGGLFALSYASAQLLLTVGRYGMRTYQATDLRFQYSFREYMTSRVITIGAMLILGVCYSFLSFEGHYVLMSALVIAMKAIDAAEDIYHGRLQQTNHVEQMGKSQAIRNGYTAICFSVSLIIYKDLIKALTVTVVSSILLCIIMNQWLVRRYAAADETERRCSAREVGRLLWSCTGIFVGTFLSLLLYNIPKYAMADILEAEYQTYYSILFMPSFVVTLLCEFVFKPTITIMADCWFSGERKKFNRMVLVGLLFIAGCTVVVMVGGHVIGRRLLELLYGVDLRPYKLHFLVLLLGGGVSASVYLIYNILIAIRHGGSIKTVYGIVAVLSIVAVRPMILHMDMMGAALNYLLSCTMLLLVFSCILCRICLKQK